MIYDTAIHHYHKSVFQSIIDASKFIYAENANYPMRLYLFFIYDNCCTLLTAPVPAIKSFPARSLCTCCFAKHQYPRIYVVYR